MTSATPAFEPLIKLLHGDSDKIRRMLDLFERVTRSDLEQLDQAFARHDWAAMRALAHKMKSGCMQLGEGPAADALVTVERALPPVPGDEALVPAFSAARDELDHVMMRVAEYLAQDE